MDHEVLHARWVSMLVERAAHGAEMAGRDG